MAGRLSQTTRSLAADTSGFARTAWLLGIAILAVWGIWFFLGSVTVYEISKQARLEARQSPHPVNALIAGKVDATNLVIGKDVKAGDVLVELDASSEKYRLREEEARLQAIPGQIASLRREIEFREGLKAKDMQSAQAAGATAKYRIVEADAAAEFARETEKRVTRLSSTGTASAVDASRAANDVQKLAASREAISSDLQRLEADAQMRGLQHDAQIEIVKRTVASLEGDIEITKAKIARLQVDIERRLLRAPMSGRIGEAVPLAEGGYVPEGQRVATILPDGDLIIVADFEPSSALGRIREGQKARLRLDGFPWAQFGSVSATVSRVAGEIRNNTVRVELTLDSATDMQVAIQHGLPGALEVAVEHATPAALVVRAAGLLFSAPPARVATAGSTS